MHPQKTKIAYLPVSELVNFLNLPKYAPFDVHGREDSYKN